jgi:hypothetical protein
MDAFGKREQAFEEAFAHADEVRFKILARRNVMIAKWAADKLGYTRDTAARYIEEISNALSVPTTDAKHNDDRVIAKLVLELTTAGWDITREGIHKVMADFEAEARRALLSGNEARDKQHRSKTLSS